jgi:hypothetical protein
MQFDQFMKSIGCNTMVRGHEKIQEGFRTLYEGHETVLLNLFSAGGADNGDLPEDSSYRAVTPMALTISLDGDKTQITPWKLDYARYNDPTRNQFFATRPEIDHKVE